jgi:hypothetical protein
VIRGGRYYNDLFELDLDELRWCAVGNPLDIGPSPRSACQLALLDNTLVRRATNPNPPHRRPPAGGAEQAG